MEDFNHKEMKPLLAASTNPINPQHGDVVEGIIVRIDQTEILVDIGLKSEAILSTKDLPASGYGSFSELHLNDKVLVYVIQPESSAGHAIISLKRANTERQWRIAEVQYKNGELLRAKVIDYNKGGLIVDVAGIRGFVPISQILSFKREEIVSGEENQEIAAKLQSMKEKELQLKIIEVNRTRNRLILSERLVHQERSQHQGELPGELKPKQAVMPVKIFFCYAREDELLKQMLEKQLRVLKRQNLIDIWHDREISPGTEWEQEIDKNLSAAQLILLLISPDFIDSDYCFGIEMKRAMERHERREARVIPIILRHVYWQGTPFGKLQALPKDAKPITSSHWHNLDEAFFDVAEGIREAVGKLIT